MNGSQLIEKLVLDAKSLGSLETRKDIAAETVKRLSDEASCMRQIIADLIRKRKSERLRSQRTVILTEHLRVRRKWLGSVNEDLHRTLDQQQLLRRQIDLLNARVSEARGRLKSSYRV